MRTRSKFSRYWTVFALGARTMFGQGVKANLAWMFTTVVLAGVTMALYVEAYRASPQALSLSAAAWSLAIASLLRLTWRHLAGIIANDVRSGDIALRIRYPFPYFGYIFVEHLGFSVPVLMVVPFLCLMAWFADGLPSIVAPHIAIPVACFMALGGIALSTLMYGLMGLLAFWMEDPSPVLRIVEKIAYIFGGAIVPLALLPTAARSVVELIPLAATGFAAQVTDPDFLIHAPRLFIIECTWLLAIGVAFAFVWRKAQQRIQVNGG